MSINQLTNLSKNLRSTSIILIIGISLSLFLLSCGSGIGPQEKVNNPERGNCALDCSSFPQDGDDIGVVFMGQSQTDMSNKPFTIETWIKSKTANLTGPVFSRATDSNGILLYVENNNPKFTIRKDGATPYILDSGYSLVQDEWTHLAALLSNVDHSNAHASCTDDVGKATSIALDSSDNAHISYRGTVHLNHATNASGQWVTETIDKILEISDESTSIAVDTNNELHISYHDTNNSSQKYITDSSGSWVSETVTSFSTEYTVEEYNSIALDSADNAYISSYITWDPNNVNKKRIIFSDNTSGSWVGGFPQLGASAMGQYNSTALDSSDAIHVSFYNVTDGNLHHATCPAANNCNVVQVGGIQQWTKTTVDAVGNVGRYTSVATDSNDKAHISYYDVTNGDLKYATNASGTWVGGAAIVHSGGNVGQYTSIAIDSNNRAHISYYDVTNGDLKYATNASGVWVNTTVDNIGDVGQYTSIAIDLNNEAHISYYDVTNGDLKYVTNASGAWDDATTVDSGDARSEIPHMDIYVNGTFQNCTSTGGNYSDSLSTLTSAHATCESGQVHIGQTTSDINEAVCLHSAVWGGGFPIGALTRLDAVIDDVRIWSEARTEAKINECLGTELPVSGGGCKIDLSILKGYWKYNECEGSGVSDHAGVATGIINTCDGSDGDGDGLNTGDKCSGDVNCSAGTAEFNAWNGGWTDGYPF